MENNYLITWSSRIQIVLSFLKKRGELINKQSTWSTSILRSKKSSSLDVTVSQFKHLVSLVSIPWTMDTGWKEARYKVCEQNTFLCIIYEKILSVCWKYWILYLCFSFPPPKKKCANICWGDILFINPREKKRPFYPSSSGVL